MKSLLSFDDIKQFLIWITFNSMLVCTVWLISLMPVWSIKIKKQLCYRKEFTVNYVLYQSRRSEGRSYILTTKHTKHSLFRTHRLCLIFSKIFVGTLVPGWLSDCSTVVAIGSRVLNLRGIFIVVEGFLSWLEVEYQSTQHLSQSG